MGSTNTKSGELPSQRRICITGRRKYVVAGPAYKGKLDIYITPSDTPPGTPSGTAAATQLTWNKKAIGYLMWSRIFSLA